MYCLKFVENVSVKHTVQSKKKLIVVLDKFRYILAY